MNITKQQLDKVKKYYDVEYNRTRGVWYLEKDGLEIDVEIFGNKDKEIVLKSASIGNLDKHQEIQKKIINFIYKNINKPMSFFETLMEFKSEKLEPFKTYKFVISKHGKIYENDYAMKKYYDFQHSNTEQYMKLRGIEDNKVRVERIRNLIYTDYEFSSFSKRFFAPPQPIMESYVKFFKEIEERRLN